MARTDRDGLDNVDWEECDFIEDGECPCGDQDGDCIAGLSYQTTPRLSRVGFDNHPFSTIKEKCALECHGDYPQLDDDEADTQGNWEHGSEYEIAHRDNDHIVAIASIHTWSLVDACIKVKRPIIVRTEISMQREVR